MILTHSVVLGDSELEHIHICISCNENFISLPSTLRSVFPPSGRLISKSLWSFRRCLDTDYPQIATAIQQKRETYFGEEPSLERRTAATSAAVTEAVTQVAPVAIIAPMIRSCFSARAMALAYGMFENDIME